MEIRKLILTALAVPPALLAQSNWPGIQPGISTRAEVERVAGAAVQAVTQTLVEYNGAKPGDRAFVQYRATGVVERVEVLLASPMDRATLIRNLGLGQPEVSRQNARGQTEELFGSKMTVLTLGAGGVERTAYYSRELFEAAGGRKSTVTTSTNYAQPPVPSPTADGPGTRPPTPSVARPGTTTAALPGGVAPTRGGGTSAGGQVAVNSIAVWPNSRTADNVPANAFDGTTTTFTWTTPSYSNVNPSYLGVGFAPANVARIRLFKDNDSGGSGPIAKILVIEYTTDPPSTPLPSRTWRAVTGMANGFQGSELMSGARVNPKGVVIGDNHNSPASGWASLTFDAVNATGLRVGFSNATPLQYNHYRVYELEVYGR
jgi:hypothetical protein